jgi:AraC-like DNA-binding protein
MSSIWFHPEPPLNEFISLYLLTDYKDLFKGDIVHVYPTGHAALCLSLDQPIVFKELPSGEMFVHDRFNFIHPFSQPRSYEIITFPTRVLHIVFKPYGAYRLLGIPQNSTFDAHGTSLRNIMSAEIAPLLSQLVDIADNSSQVVQLVMKWLESQLLKRGKLHIDHVQHACRLIDMSHGNLSIEQLAKEVWLSKRALEYQFQQQVGLSPKLYSRIMRFNASLAWINSHKDINWQDVAARYNYFDQAHFIREFKFFSGDAPSRLLTHRHLISKDML